MSKCKAPAPGILDSTQLEIGSCTSRTTATLPAPLPRIHSSLPVKRTLFPVVPQHLPPHLNPRAAAPPSDGDVVAYVGDLLGPDWSVRARSRLDSIAVNGPARHLDVYFRGTLAAFELARAALQEEVSSSVHTTAASMHNSTGDEGHHQLSFFMNESWSRTRSDRHAKSPLISASTRIASVATTARFIKVTMHEPHTHAERLFPSSADRVAKALLDEEQLAYWNEEIIAVAVQAQLSSADQRILLSAVNKQLLAGEKSTAESSSTLLFWVTLSLAEYVPSVSFLRCEDHSLTSI